MAKENSVERAERLIRDCDDTIKICREYETDTRKRIENIDSEIAALQEQRKTLLNEIDDSKSEKMDAIYTKMALQQFIESGGGLDMFVE